MAGIISFLNKCLINDESLGKAVNEVSSIENNRIFREIKFLSVKYANFYRQSFFLSYKRKPYATNLLAVLIKRLNSLVYRGKWSKDCH